MSVSDRLRAEKPPENDGRWKRCEIVELKSSVAVVKDGGSRLTLELTEELVDLFESRWEDNDAWYIKK